MLLHRLPIVALVLGVTACAVSPAATPPFAALQGCWHSANYGTLNWQPTAGDQWIGSLRRESGWCSTSDQPGLGGCAFLLGREGDTWRFEDTRTDNVQTYRLVANHGGIATFAAEALRRPNDSLSVQVEQQHISIATTGSGGPVMLFEGDRCEAR